MSTPNSIRNVSCRYCKKSGAEAFSMGHPSPPSDPSLHRVTNTSGRERYSIPLFVHPDYRQVIDARDLAAPGEEIRFEPIVAGETVYANFARQRVSWGATVPPPATGSAPVQPA